MYSEWHQRNAYPGYCHAFSPQYGYHPACTVSADDGNLANYQSASVWPSNDLPTTPGMTAYPTDLAAHQLAFYRSRYLESASQMAPCAGFPCGKRIKTENCDLFAAESAGYAEVYNSPALSYPRENFPRDLNYFPVHWPIPPATCELSCHGIENSTRSTGVTWQKTTQPHTSRREFVCKWITSSSSSGDVEAISSHYRQPCNAHFFEMNDLVAHVKSHIGDQRQRDHTCYWQGCSRRKPFTAKYKLVSHVRCHTGEKPFHCPFFPCKKEFARKENLKVHKRHHTGEKPFHCKFPGCRRRFTNSSDRIKHERVHTCKTPYDCKVVWCDKRFVHASSLRKHMHRHQKYGDLDERRFIVSSDPSVTLHYFQDPANTSASVAQHGGYSQETTIESRNMSIQPVYAPAQDTLESLCDSPPKPPDPVFGHAVPSIYSLEYYQKNYCKMETDDSQVSALQPHNQWDSHVRCDSENDLAVFSQ